MANLTGMPISSLPETTLQEGDQVVGYRAETGKAYRTDLADQIADLTEQVNQLNQSLSEQAFTKRSILISLDASTDGQVSYIMQSDGFIMLEGSTSSTSGEIFERLDIRGCRVFQGYSPARNYQYYCTGLYQVHAGDTIRYQVTLPTDGTANLYLYT